jgi:hypothetical protein
LLHRAPDLRSRPGASYRLPAARPSGLRTASSPSGANGATHGEVALRPADRRSGVGDPGTGFAPRPNGSSIPSSGAGEGVATAEVAARGRGASPADRRGYRPGLAG